MQKFATQQVTLNFTALGQTIGDSFELDRKYNKVESIEIFSSLQPAPALLQKLNFDGMDSPYSKGTAIGYFQDIPKKAYPVNIKLQGYTMEYEVKDNSNAFVPYYVQIIVKLVKE